MRLHNRILMDHNNFKINLIKMLKTITKNISRFFAKSITNREALNSALDE